MRTPVPGDVSEAVHTLADYRIVEGLQLPHETTERNELGKFATWHLTYKLNVDYDPAIFQGPPSLAGGREGWRKKTSAR